MKDPITENLYKAISLLEEAAALAVNKKYPNESIHALCFVRDLLKRIHLTIPVPTKK